MASGNITLSLERVAKQKGVVVLPIEEYERMREDLQMAQSKKLPKDIARARQEVREGKFVTMEKALEHLRL
jgi:PHD/YefM family antitoxin component YafN of YafNO toxin-antitoxin module